MLAYTRVRKAKGKASASKILSLVKRGERPLRGKPNEHKLKVSAWAAFVLGQTQDDPRNDVERRKTWLIDFCCGHKQTHKFRCCLPVFFLFPASQREAFRWENCVWEKWLQYWISCCIKKYFLFIFSFFCVWLFFNASEAQSWKVYNSQRLMNSLWHHV
jgi:hypothetical protein